MHDGTGSSQPHVSTAYKYHRRRNVTMCNLFINLCWDVGYWHERVERHGNPQGNQELSVVRDKVGKPPGELAVSKSGQCDIYPLKCFDTVGWMTGRASGL